MNMLKKAFSKLTTVVLCFALVLPLLSVRITTVQANSFISAIDNTVPADAIPDASKIYRSMRENFFCETRKDYAAHTRSGMQAEA